MKNLWKNLPKPKLRPLIIGILFVVFCCIISTGNRQSDSVNEISSTERENETQLAETPETETEVISFVANETESEIATETESVKTVQTQPSTEITLFVDSIPAYSGEPYVAINANTPQFLDADLSTSSYEYYSDLDELGRCGGLCLHRH